MSAKPTATPDPEVSAGRIQPRQNVRNAARDAARRDARDAEQDAEQERDDQAIERLAKRIFAARYANTEVTVANDEEWARAAIKAAKAFADGWLDWVIERAQRRRQSREVRRLARESEGA